MVKETRLYDLLEVQPDATNYQLRRAFIKMTKKYHPDKNPTGNDRMQIIHSTYRTLIDERKRKIYDIFGEKELSRLNLEFHKTDNRFRQSTDEDGVRRIEYDMDVSLEELYCGSLRVVNVKISTHCKECKEEEQDDHCEKCNGKKIVNKEHEVYVHVPLGAPNNYLLTYDLGNLDSQPIKFSVHLKELKHPTFKRNGDNLIIPIRLDVVEALTDFDKTIKTLDNRMICIRTLANDRTVKEGQTMVLQREGMPNFDNPLKKGGMLITFFAESNILSNPL